MTLQVDLLSFLFIFYKYTSNAGLGPYEISYIFYPIFLFIFLITFLHALMFTLL